METTTDRLKVRLKSMSFEALGICSFELRPLDGEPLPPFTAGAHIDVHLPSGLARSYSLVNRADERHRYVITVAKDAASRGGSRYMHERLRPGDTLAISPPRNNFPLFEAARHSVLISGGIGITPLWSMVQRLESLGRSWRLHYCARTREHAAFMDRLARLPAKAQANVLFNFDQEPGGKILDIQAVVATEAPDTHFYCCGPAPMLAAFEKATAARPPQQVHLERFAAKEPAAAGGGYSVVLAKSQKTLAVAAGQTILDAVLAAGVEVKSGCREGICGSCAVRVLEGVPDHRDSVLSKEQQDANANMMICCSGSKSERLVLDL